MDSSPSAFTFVSHPDAPGAIGAPNDLEIRFEFDGSDQCESAKPIADPFTFAFDNSVATTDGAWRPLCDEFGYFDIDHDVWFDWTAGLTGTTVMSMCALPNVVDTRIAVYDGAGCAGTLPACSDDSCDTHSDAVAGQAHKLRVGMFQNTVHGTGAFVMSAEDAYAPNTTCDNAPTLTTGDYPGLLLQPTSATGDEGRWRIDAPAWSLVSVDLLHDAEFPFADSQSLLMYRRVSGSCPGETAANPDALPGRLNVTAENNGPAAIFRVRVKNFDDVFRVPGAATTCEQGGLSPRDRNSLDPGQGRARRPGACAIDEFCKRRVFAGESGRMGSRSSGGRRPRRPDRKRPWTRIPRTRAKSSCDCRRVTPMRPASCCPLSTMSCARWPGECSGMSRHITRFSRRRLFTKRTCG